MGRKEANKYDLYILIPGVSLVAWRVVKNELDFGFIKTVFATRQLPAT